MHYKAIIFDMDGTIIDTTHIWRQATKELITNHGIDFDHEQHQDLHMKLHGLGMKESCSIIKNHFNLNASVTSLMEEKSQLAANLYQKNVCFIEGFQQFHMKVKEAQLKTGIATNADDVTLKITNSILNLEQFFGEHIYSISQVNYICKPNPAIYLLAAQKLNVDPKECIAIEDSAHGIEAAKKAGIFCVGINTGKNRALIQHCDLIIDSYEELELSNLLTRSLPS